MNLFAESGYDRPNVFSPKELMLGAGINTALYNQWLYRNIFSATYEADGPGTKSEYTFDDILVVGLIVTLRRADIRLKKASRLAHDIVSGLNEWTDANDNPSQWPKVYLSYDVDGELHIDVGEDRSMTMVLRLDVHTIALNICGRIDGV